MHEMAKKRPQEKRSELGGCTTNATERRLVDSQDTVFVIFRSREDAPEEIEHRKIAEESRDFNR